MTTNLSLKIFLLSICWINCSYAQHVNWKKYQRFDDAIDAVVTTRFQIDSEDAIVGQALETYLQPQSVTKEILTPSGLIDRIEKNSDVTYYTYEDQILKSISNAYNSYVISHNKFEDRYILHQQGHRENKRGLYLEYVFDGPHIIKQYKYKKNAVLRFKEYKYDDRGRLTEEYTSAQKDSYTKYNYTQNQIVNSTMFVNDTFEITTLYLYDQTELDFDKLLKSNPNLQIIKVENNVNNHTLIRKTYYKSAEENIFEERWVQEEVKDERGNPIKINTTTLNQIHTITYQYFYREE